MKVVLMVLLFAGGHTYKDGPAGGDVYSIHIAKGNDFYRSFDNKQALSEYRTAYALAPDRFETLQKLVRIYNDLGRLTLHKDAGSEFYYRKALAYADSLREHFPDRAETHFWLALCKGSLIPFVGVREKIAISDSVLREADKAIAIDSSFALPYVILGIFQREASKMSWLEHLLANVVFGANFSGSLPASEALLRKSVALDSLNSFGYFELARTYRAMEDSAHAIACLQKLLTLPPTSARERQQAEIAERQLAMLLKKR